jgi:GntR family transcriptional regulator
VIPAIRDAVAIDVGPISCCAIDSNIAVSVVPRIQDCSQAMFAIDGNDPTPLYAQLERAIRVAIATGRLNVGDKLPTVRQLAVDLKINANTVAKVYAELERSGVLETRRGVGTFIRHDGPRGPSPPDLERLLVELADRFLAGAATLGFSADEAINFLKVRWIDMKREQSDA